MKLLLDTCVSPRTRDKLTAAGHDVTWVGDWGDDPGDENILDIARRESRVLVTLDKDFGELTVVFGREHAGIIRLVDVPVEQQAIFCLRTLERYGDDVVSGAVVTVEASRVRVRPRIADTTNDSET